MRGYRRTWCGIGTRRAASGRSPRSGPCFDTGRMETTFPPIGKTGTGLAEQRGQINFPWEYKECISLFLSQASRKIFWLLFEDPLGDSSHQLLSNCSMTFYLLKLWIHLWHEILGILSLLKLWLFGPRRLWCGVIPSRIQESQKWVSLFKEFKAK